MGDGFIAPEAHNEPVLPYRPGSPERDALLTQIERTAEEIVDIPLVVGGEAIATGDISEVVMPHDHQKVVARAHKGTRAHVDRAIAAAQSAKSDWATMAPSDRAAVFLKAAELLTGSWRARVNAATMLGQSKSVHQAEIDTCALADFWRYGAEQLSDLLYEQPLSGAGAWNQVELRPLDGFVFAVAPFNFTSIAANLATAPALMGNAVLWKPAPTQMRSAHAVMQLLHAAGLPPGVINLLHGVPSAIGDAVLASPELGGLHFTGSGATFRHLYGAIGKNIGAYRQFPTVVGETGGKGFVFAHASADVDALATAIVRGGYEYQGQKCSAASRVYVPRSLWGELKDRLIADIGDIKVGDPGDLANFMGAVIDAKAYNKITGYVQHANGSSDCKVLTGGEANDAKGWFVQPALVETSDPKQGLMREEIFGPVVTVWVYENESVDEAVGLCESSTPYGLTGAVFARDRRAIAQITSRLRFAAGNMYINDKPTGSQIGHQPFGGSRGSGTNDKTGSVWNLMRWASPRTIKESFAAPTDFRYPHMRT